jgi:hypothetical protein
MCSQVFDDWKAHMTRATHTQGQSALPRLSLVTLAFLEASCRADPAFEWRVYDVCAAMRQQRERKHTVRDIRTFLCNLWIRFASLAVAQLIF